MLTPMRIYHSKIVAVERLHSASAQQIAERVSTIMILKVSAGCWINTDLIARVEDRQVEPRPENSIAVYLPADGSFSLYDAEADNLRMWLDQQALDLSAPAFQDDDYQLFLRKGGTWSYSDWCAARDRLTDYIERPDSWWQVTENAAKVRELEVELKH